MFELLKNKIGSMGDVTAVKLSTGSTTIAVSGTDTVYTQSFKLSFGVAFGIWYKAASSGNVNVKIQLEQSYTTPATEGSSSTNYVIGSGVSDIDSALTDTTVRVKTVSPVPMKYGRLKITGLTGNDATTTLSIQIFQQEYNR